MIFTESLPSPIWQADSFPLTPHAQSLALVHLLYCQLGSISHLKEVCFLCLVEKLYVFFPKLYEYLEFALGD